jgi:hypothetical protein
MERDADGSERFEAVVVAIIQAVVIVLWISLLETITGGFFWYADRLVWYPLLWSLQWLLLTERPSFALWMRVSVPMMLICAAITATVVQSLILDPILSDIRASHPPPTTGTAPFPEDYYFMESLVQKSVRGIGLGLGQWMVLKRTDVVTRWSIPITTAAYVLTAVWMYRH